VAIIFPEIATMKRVLLALVIALSPVPGVAVDPAGNSDRPLLMAGKQTLYQRVLSVPGARISARPGGKAGATVIPFTAFYVYARKRLNDREWIEVGTDRFGTRAGWLSADDSIEWNSGLTVAFRDPTGHDRVLLFENSEAVRQLAGQSDLKEYKRLYAEALQGQKPADSPVVAIQPPGYIDIREDFYLVPIHRFETSISAARRHACCRYRASLWTVIRATPARPGPASMPIPQDWCSSLTPPCRCNPTSNAPAKP
jgi:hypothetical protein